MLPWIRIVHHIGLTPETQQKKITFALAIVLLMAAVNFYNGNFSIQYLVPIALGIVFLMVLFFLTMGRMTSSKLTDEGIIVKNLIGTRLAKWGNFTQIRVDQKHNVRLTGAREFLLLNIASDPAKLLEKIERSMGTTAQKTDNALRK